MAPPALKRLERGWKRLAMRGLAAALPAPDRAGAPPWGERPMRVLYLRHDRIGDMIMVTGLLRAMAASHPGVTLDVLASAGNAPVLLDNPHVHDVVPFDRHRAAGFPRAFADLRRRGYDAVVDGWVTNPSMTTAMIMLASGAPYRIGVGGRMNEFVYTHPVPPAPPGSHMIPQYAAVLRAFGVDPERADLRTELFLRPDETAWAEATWQGTRAADAPDGARRLLLNISASIPGRNWTDERFVAVLRRVRERWPGTQLLAISAPSDAERLRAIAGAGGAVPVDAGLRQAMALVGAADVVFTPDTSVAHMAAALHVPAVVLHQRSNVVYAPWGNTGRSIYSDDETLGGIGPERAASAVDEVLEQVAARPALGRGAGER